MARVGKRGVKKAAKKEKKRKRKRKVTVSPQAQAGTTPYIPDTSSWDVANEVARRRRDQTATTAQPPMSPVFHGNIPSEATGSASGTGAAAALAGESSLSTDGTVITAHERMLARLAELEATVAELLPLLPSTPGIGHNNPPPLDRTELEDIKNDIALLKALPPPPPVEASKVANKFVRVAGRVLSWFGNHLNTFITEFMKASGKAAGTTAGTALVLSPLWLPFGHQLTDSAVAIMQWIMTLVSNII